MFNGMDAGPQGILHPARSMGMGGHMPAMRDGDFDGRSQFFNGHLCLVW